MNFTWSDEQEAIFAAAANPDIDLIVVDAVAGASKTTILTEISKRESGSKQLYLAFGKAMQVEASKRFSSTTECKTIHALAYSNTVRHYGLNVGTFNYRNIKCKLKYEDKVMLLNLIENFCLSKYLSIEEYIINNPSYYHLKDHADLYLEQMGAGIIECTHSFYLKLFHVLLATGELAFDELDLLMVDEFGDITELTIEIFKLMPAKTKVAVGDKRQAIFKFMNCVNGFHILKDEGVHLQMTKSFRVHKDIAKYVETFCKTHIDKDMVFNGIDYDELYPHSTELYISRTNGALIERMLDLNETRSSYSLARTAYTTFALPLTLASLKKDYTITNKEFKFLETDIKNYFTEPNLQFSRNKLLTYIMEEHPHDIQLKSACKLVMRHGSKAIFDAYAIAKEHEIAAQSSLVLGTAHSLKGLEADKVVIAEELNKYMETCLKRKAMADSLSDEEVLAETGYTADEIYEEYNEATLLGYVAATRAKKQLIGANYLYK